jgi:hypothetical protein
VELADETAITEITILPDGRIYLFGASRRVMTVLKDLCPHDTALLARIAHSARAVEERLAARYISLPAPAESPDHV